MSKKVIVEVVADVAKYERGLRRAAGDTHKFEREVSRMSRGAAAGSGIFSGLGKSIAFASGGFLAFASGTEFLRKSVDAAREAQVAQRSLAAQMKAAGESFTDNKDRIEQVAHSYARFGFQNDEVIASLTVLERATGSINKAIALQGLTADLARAKNLDLAAAAAVVGKVFGGQETALRRAVPGLSKTAHGLDLIREAQRKLAGQAAANTTETEKFGAALHDTEEVIGAALLPALDQLLGKATKWLQNTKNQKQLTKDLTGITEGLVTAVEDLAGAYGDAKKASSGFDPLGFGNIRGRKGILPFSSKDIVGTLTGRKGILYDQIVKAFGFLAPGGFQAAPRPPSNNPAGGAAAEAAAKAAHGLAVAARAAAAAAAEIKKIPKITVEQRNNWFDAMIGRQLARVQDVDSLKAQNARLRAINAEIQKRLAITKDRTRWLNLEAQYLDIQNTIRLNNKQAAEDAAAAAEERKQKQRDAVEAAKTEALAWADFAIERASVTKTLKDDLKTAQAKLDLLRKQAGVGKKSAAEAQTIWEAQQEVFRIRKEMAGQDTAFAKFKPIDASKFVQGLGLDLSLAQTRNLIGAVAGISRGGKLPPGRTAAFAGAAGMSVNIEHFYSSAENPKQMEAELMKRAKARPQPRRGAR
jgi:hypothetical protein